MKVPNRGWQHQLLAKSKGVHREVESERSYTLHGWISKFGKHGDKAFPGSGHLHEADEELRRLHKENMDLKEENAILKKSAAYFAKNLK
ncbi:hypothetical protein [Desulfotomaculum nigrificans]|uniref:hypothetical protein n=1 Tax=Desulfotomaculum nigrificans TaxID=1565 RepID=UPI0012DEECFB|nr:hypothetical protein [Desulfotomaculum nigrificans]